MVEAIGSHLYHIFSMPKSPPSSYKMAQFRAIATCIVIQHKFTQNEVIIIPKDSEGPPFMFMNQTLQNQLEEVGLSTTQSPPLNVEDKARVYNLVKKSHSKKIFRNKVLRMSDEEAIILTAAPE